MNKQYLQIINAVVLCFGLSQMAGAAPAPGCWVTGDFHQHSLNTDGSFEMPVVHAADVFYGLDWWAASEHGGLRGGVPRWMDIGGYADVVDDGQPNSWSMVQDSRLAYPDKVIVQGVEWNVPGHEHCSVGIITGQFDGVPTTDAIAEFEYTFDNGNGSYTGGGPDGIWVKSLFSGHAKAVEAAVWMNANHPWTAWMVPAHPERRQSYTISDFRDLNNASPTVCFGFESMPGHQKSGGRGGYSTNADGGGTYGGCGVYAAQVGGLWDAMLGEGRAFWLFASSDFHSTGGDYWPGEYQKTYTFVAEKQNPQAIVDGLRSGNSFVVEGDLINALDFTLQYGSSKATMGEVLSVEPKNGRGNPVKITIKFKSPASNHAPAPINNIPVVDHIDLIAGDVTGIVEPTLADGSHNPAYDVDSHPSTQVIATFRADGWEIDEDGWNVMHCFMRVDHDMFFRLRGTNLRPGMDVLDIDDNGNPLRDDVNPAQGDEEAWNDLWFYSNPVFLDVE